MSSKKFLIVVDMQNDFVDGALGTKEAQQIVANAVKRIQECREMGYQVIVTQDTHCEEYLNTAEGKKLPIKHCVIATDGWQIYPDIKNEISNGDSKVYLKPTFGSTDLANDLVRAEADTIELIGLCTDICVISNALLLKAFLPDATIQVNASCCAGVTPELHEAALKVMKSCQIDII